MHIYTAIHPTLLPIIQKALCIMVCIGLASNIANAAEPQAHAHPIMQNVISSAKEFKLSVYSAHAQLPVNALHQWVVEVHDRNDQPVAPALVEVAGGMPGHGHGLPTQPQMTKDLGNGRYLIEGMKFNMDGKWLIKLRITTPELRDTAEFELMINY